MYYGTIRVAASTRVVVTEYYSCEYSSTSCSTPALEYLELLEYLSSYHQWSKPSDVWTVAKGNQEVLGIRLVLRRVGISP
jgi:hypothetical protein